MYNRNGAVSGRGHLRPSPDTHPRQFNHHGPPFRRPPHLQHHWKPQFSPHYRDRPPNISPSKPNFIVQLRSDAPRAVEVDHTKAVIQKLKFQPQKSIVVASNFVSGTLYYEQWSEALETVVQLWDMKLSDHGEIFWPGVIFNVEVPSDKLELNDRLKVVFVEKLKGLLNGYLIQKWEDKLDNVKEEIKKVSGSNKLIKIEVWQEMRRKKEGLNAEKDLISKRLEEFKSGINYIVNCLENGKLNDEEVIPVFRISDGEINWARIYKLMMRECRRLDDGLPIYAHRTDILKQIHSQQVTVLIGETGSGKSTQLVQFLADSGVSGNDSIICTQPRKLAAMSLAERVQEESAGCYKDTPPVTCYPSYSSIQQFDSKVIFMTDNCLLQHYMRDKQLSKISCIIVDEAHERSLNTDLLLALIKNLLCQRPFLRLIIMSATADADQFAEYFFGCRTLHVTGRNFPVDTIYVPCENDGFSVSKLIPSYVHDVVRVVTEINRNERDGTILAFLTSQMEVEFACEEFRASSAIALPLHGKLSYEDQRKVFLTYPGKRKVIFATNVAETSLTIPGVKYVVDSGMVKDSRFEPSTGMNVLRVCRISRSSANQRAGRAGRTEPGTCYRLYTESDFESLLPHQEPEIRKVHLGVAVMKILALGIKNVQDFDFVDAPSVKAIDMAVRNLIHLGIVEVKDNVYGLTSEGREMVKLGIEPRLGKIILQSVRHRLGKEGLVLAAVMANSSSIFCRVGKQEDKFKSDCLKVQFCHPNGDLFTLLAVYKEWEAVPREKKNVWCWENSINAKSMRRCYDAVVELENSLQNELSIIVPNYYYWNPQVQSEHDTTLKNIILSSLAENVAMYSGYDQLGYEVALTRKHIQLHPSCSLLNFGQRPAWVVFGDILSVSNEYLVCVTACDFNHLSALSPPPLFDFVSMVNQQLQKRVLSGSGSVLLKRFCGKFNSNTRRLVSCIRESCEDERIGVEVDVAQNEITLYAPERHMDKVCGLVNDGLEYEKRLLQNECLEKCLYTGGPTVLPSIALFGGGAEIKHLELEKRYLTVDIFHSNIDGLDDKELLSFLEMFTLGQICAVSKFSCVVLDNEEKDKWGKVTFLTPDAAKRAVDLCQFEIFGGLLKVVPSRNIYGGDHKTSFPALRAKIFWPRRCSKGVGIVKCDQHDIPSMLNDFSNLVIGERLVYCKLSDKFMDNIVITGLDRDLSEAEIFQVLSASTSRRILDFFLVRGKEVYNPPPIVACEEAILREISPFMPKRSPQVNGVRVQVFPPEPKDSFVRAAITFDGSLHLEAAKALEQIDGKVLPGCLSWQKIRCLQLFHSSVSCPASVYHVIRNQLDALLSRLRRRKGVECCNLERNQNGSYRVRISASATKIVAELRRPLEQLMKGKILENPEITPAVLQVLFSQEGYILMKSIQRETGTHIFFDRRNMIVRVFGSPDTIDGVENRLVKAILALHDTKQLEIRLRDGILPPDMMKRVVQNFGPDLHGLKEKVPQCEFRLNTKRHCISIVGPKESKQKVENIIQDLAQSSELLSSRNHDNESACPICLCEVEDSYTIENCGHKFCCSCLVEQCESAIKGHDNFPLKCTKEGCGAPILLTDLRSLLSSEKLDELFWASLDAYVAANGGSFRFCPSPDCPSVYRVAGPDGPGAPFVCGACFVETCTKCHVEYHPYLSCEKYKEFKDDPESSLKEWCKGKDAKMCPVCGFTIEKIEGCNHIECRCGKHICWVCLEFFGSSEECYGHLRSVHLAII